MVSQVSGHERPGSDLDLLHLLDELFQELIVDTLLHKYARPAEAYLALIGEAGAHACRNRLAQVGVIENYIGVLAA